MIYLFSVFLFFRWSKYVRLTEHKKERIWKRTKFSEMDHTDHTMWRCHFNADYQKFTYLFRFTETLTISFDFV